MLRIHESIQQHLIFHLLITASLLTTIVLYTKAQTENNRLVIRKYILGSGFIGLLIGLMVFPIGSLQMMDALETASRKQAELAIVAGGFSLPFIPLLYGIICFLISLGGWFALYKQTSTDNL